MTFRTHIAFKEANVTKEGLLSMGQELMIFLAKVEGINAELEKFNQSKTNLFDDNELSLRTRDIDEALEAVQTKLGELAMKEAAKKK